MWNVDPEVMCDQHLLGEHNEMHMLTAGIRKHPHGEAIAKGHAEKQQVNTSLIQERHDELAEEMERRGMNHDSPLDYEDELNVGEVDVDRHLQMLADRCGECRERIL
jgi:hypothetical protein